MMDNRDEVKEFIKFAKENKVEQVTLRPVNDEYRRESAHGILICGFRDCLYRADLCRSVPYRRVHTCFLRL